MRDPNRIQPTLKAIGEAWKRNPDLRLSQLLFNTRADYNTEDDKLVELVEKMYPARELPTRVGSMIYWREDNDAGHNARVFAERISDITWRVNGFDNYSNDTLNSMISHDAKGDWVQLEEKE